MHRPLVVPYVDIHCKILFKNSRIIRNIIRNDIIRTFPVGPAESGRQTLFGEFWAKNVFIKSYFK